jgi:hypothetical protein
MIKSMTGFASLTREFEAATISATIKSVNHRFLDLQLRIPASIAPLETKLRTLVQKRVARGRVEVVVGVQQRRAATLDVELNEEFLTALGGAIERARQQGYVAGEMTPGDLLRFPQALAIRERITETDADLAPSRRWSRTLWMRRSTSSMPCATLKAAICGPTSMRGGPAGDVRTRRPRSDQGKGLQARLHERVRALRAAR